MKNILREIHHRSLWQVLGIYIGASWLVLQVVQTMSEGLRLPDWITPFAFILLLIGLPVVLATAFLQRGLSTRTPESPPQTLAELGEIPPEPPEPLPKAVRLLTWKRALLGGLGAALLLMLAAGGWAVMRSAGIGPAATLVARGVLDERDVILLADFETASGDSSLADVITEAMRVDLSQSGTVRLADGAFLAGALSRMALPTDTRVSAAIAREIGQREGLKALVAGEVARAGAGFSLTATVETPDTGEILVSHRETAGDSTVLLRAIDDLSQRLRERIGDPLGAIAATPPLAQVTTSNLAALRKFTEAIRLPNADIQRTIQLLEEAVALDSSFAYAWRALGISLQNYGAEPGRAMEATTRAFALRGHLTPRERDGIEALYYVNVTREPRRAIPVFEAAIERDPEDVAPLINVGEAYRNLGELGTALDWYQRALEVDSTESIALMNVAQVSTTLGDFDAASDAAERLDRYGHRPFGPWHRGMTATAIRDYEAAEETLTAVRDEATRSPFLLATTTHWLAAAVGARGRLDESARHLLEAAELQAENGSPVDALRFSILAAVTRSLASGEPDRAALDRALERYPLEAMDPIERPYLELASGYARLGHAGIARSHLEAFDATAPPEFARGLRYQRHLARGDVAAAEGRLETAIEEYRQGASRPQEIEPAVLLARAFDAAGQPDSAAVHYRRYIESTHWWRVMLDPFYLGPSLERLAELEEEAGNLEAAARRYAELVELWSEADPELQPRVARAQERLQAILDRIG